MSTTADDPCEAAPAGQQRREAVEATLAALSTRQRIGQLNQRLFGWDCVVRVGTPASPRYELTEAFHAEVARFDGMGALYGLFRADAWSGRTWRDGILPEHAAGVAEQVVAAVRAASPTGTGPLLVEEAPHGHQALGGTLFPTNLGLAASWDPELVAECAAAVSRELRAAGVHVGLVSALDLLRDPRWGRAEECLGESPTLAAELTRAMVVGMQGPDRSRVTDGTGVAIVLKHLAGQGEGSGGRNGDSAVIGPHDFAELHLPAVRAGVQAGALGLMAAYNDVDGVPCCGNPDLLTRLLRTDWGFDGIVMADGHAVDRLVAMTGSEPAAAALALRSGVDLSLWDRSYARLEEAIEQQPSLLAAVETSCRRVLALKARLGLLTGAGHLVPERDDRTTVRLSHLAAQRSLVLLGDDPTRALATFPADLEAGGRLVVVGAHADLTSSLLGDYVPPLADGDGSVLAGLRERLGDRVEHLSGLEPDRDRGWAELAALTPADTVLAVVGGTSHRPLDADFADNGALRHEGADGAGHPAGEVPEELRPTAGEGVDRADLGLPGRQAELLRALAARTTARRVAVVVCGRPHVLTDVLASCHSTVVAFYPGPQGGRAVAAALLGEQPFVGRLPATFPRSSGVVPLHDDDRLSPQGRYADAPEPVLAGLGTSHVPHPLTRTGLSATLVVAGTASTATASSGERGLGLTGLAAADDGSGEPVVRAEDATVLVRGSVHNPHDVEVEDVLQLFAHRRGGPRWPRRAELLAFTRVRLAAGTSLEVELSVPAARALPAGPGCTELWWSPPGGGSTRPQDPQAVVVLERSAD